MTAEQRNRAGMDDVEEIGCNVIQFLSNAIECTLKIASIAFETNYFITAAIGIAVIPI